MQSENMIGTGAELGRWDAITKLQLPTDDLDVVASTISHGPDEARCEQSYCPKDYCAQGYSSD